MISWSVLVLRRFEYGNIGGSKIVMEYTEVLDKQITRKQHYVPKDYLN